MWGDETVLTKIGKRIRMSGSRLALVAVLTGVTGVIVFNAVVLQPARHPAPLFAVVDAARAVQEKPPVTTVPSSPALRPTRDLQAAKPVEEKPAAKLERAAAERTPEKYERPADKFEKLLEKADKQAAKPQSVAAAPVKPQQRPSSGDALGELIRAGAVPPASIPNEPDARVMAIQKNLQRMGYAVGKPDGMMGSGTRAAIEKFERDRKWQVTGEISQRLLRELGTVSAGTRE